MIRLLARGLLHLARTHRPWRSPRAVSLALVDWYRAEVSAGQLRCPTGRDGSRASCSRYGRRVIERYGVLVGWWLAVARMRECSALALQSSGGRRDYGPQGCCEQEGGRGLCG